MSRDDQKKEQTLADRLKISVQVDGRSVEFNHSPITCADVLAAASLESGVVIRTDSDRAVHFGPEELVEIDCDQARSFVVFRTESLFHLRVEGISWDWGSPVISETDMRGIASAKPEQDFYRTNQSEPLGRGAIVDLTEDWPPRFRLQETPATAALVPISVNGREVMLARDEVTYDELVGCAFPDADLTQSGTRSLTVTYRRGPPDRPEGSLVQSEKTRIQRGTTFHVTATDKS
jgi:hypothetical protein